MLKNYITRRPEAFERWTSQVISPRSTSPKDIDCGVMNSKDSTLLLSRRCLQLLRLATARPLGATFRELLEAFVCCCLGLRSLVVPRRVPAELQNCSIFWICHCCCRSCCFFLLPLMFLLVRPAAHVVVPLCCHDHGRPWRCS